MAPPTKGRCRNPQLIRGIERFSRSKVYHKRGLWAIKAKHGGVFPKHEPKTIEMKPAEKPPKYYPADDVKKPLKNNRKAKPTKLRASITPGTVLILLAGRFMGKRVVFLKQLPSGLLLITGPFKVNGVPLRRVSQAYVIATSTKIDISGVDLSKFDDGYVKRKPDPKKKPKGDFFNPHTEDKNALPQEKKEDQKVLDSQLISVIDTIPDLKTYLSVRFTLRSGMKPHELVF